MIQTWNQSKATNNKQCCKQNRKKVAIRKMVDAHRRSKSVITKRATLCMCSHPKSRHKKQKTKQQLLQFAQKKTSHKAKIQIFRFFFCFCCSKQKQKLIFFQFFCIVFFECVCKQKDLIQFFFFSIFSFKIVKRHRSFVHMAAF